MKLAALGLMSILMSGVVFAQTNKNYSADYYKKCSLGDASACTVLGEWLTEGQESEGIEKDVFKAFEYMNKGCELGNPEGCFNLGLMYENGKGVNKSKSLALKYLGKACDLKSQEGCDSYAKLNTGK